MLAVFSRAEGCLPWRPRDKHQTPPASPSFDHQLTDARHRCRHLVRLTYRTKAWKALTMLAGWWHTYTARCRACRYWRLL